MAIITVTSELQNIFSEIYKNIPENLVAIYFNKINKTHYSGDESWSEYILDISEDEFNLKVSKIPSEERVKNYIKYNNCVPGDMALFFDKLTRIENFRISRVLSMFNANFFNNSIENFIHYYRAEYVDQISKSFEFHIIDGEQIRYWYNEKRYYPGEGSLNHSCMRHESNRLDIYVLNPDKVKLLILVNKDNKLMGRCLLWKLDHPYGKIYADRIYTVFQDNYSLFVNYINKKEWWSYDKHYNKGRIVILNHSSSWTLPYLDSFRAYEKGNSFEKKTILILNVKKPQLKIILNLYNSIKRKLFGIKEPVIERIKNFEQFIKINS